MIPRIVIEMIKLGVFSSSKAELKRMVEIVLCAPVTL